MKIYISADIEGVTGVTSWDEANKTRAEYSEFREQMTAEVAAACLGAIDAGATEIWVQDAHASGRNLIASKLPKQVKIVRGWSGHPALMVQEVDDSFSAVMMIGYHSRAGSDLNPLAHTMSSAKIDSVKINDRFASEYLIHAYAAAYHKVPVVFVSGDEGLCEHARSIMPTIETVAVKKGIGNSTVNLHPDTAVSMIKENVYKSLSRDVKTCLMFLPEHLVVDVRFKNHVFAYRASFFPGVTTIDPSTVRFETDDYFEVMRFFLFNL